MEHPLIDLLKLATEGENIQGPEGLARLELTVCSYAPVVTFQVNVKSRDATLSWATFVSPDPVSALTQALDLFLRGEEARKTKSIAVHHPTRDSAQDFLKLIEMEYEEGIAATKVELVPYKGWVVVVFPKEGHDLTELLPRVELRAIPEGQVSRVPRPAGGAPKATRSPKVPVAFGSIKPAPAGGRLAQTKDFLMAEWKGIYGKQPDQNIKKADLAKMLDDLEAKAFGEKTQEAAPEEEASEEDLL